MSENSIDFDTLYLITCEYKMGNGNTLYSKCIYTRNVGKKELIFSPLGIQLAT